jgi:hypothetical protein
MANFLLRCTKEGLAEPPRPNCTLSLRVIHDAPQETVEMMPQSRFTQVLTARSNHHAEVRKVAVVEPSWVRR